MYQLLFAVLTALIVVGVVMIARRVMKFLEGRGYCLPQSLPGMAALAFIVALASTKTFAQSTLNLDIDLSTFWVGFNEFFNTLFPPMAFIASIGAALGFIFMIIKALKSAFGGGTT